MSIASLLAFLACYLVANLLPAGVAHSLDRHSLDAVVAAQGLLSRRGRRVVGRLLGPIEIVAGALLVVSLVEPAISGPAAILALSLSSAMAVYVGVLLRAGYSGQCGCGLGEGLLGPHTMVRLLSMVMSSVVLVVLMRLSASVGAAGSVELVAGAVAGVGAALVAALMCKAGAVVRELESELLHEHRIMH